jgi:4-hydroxy-4-methyl-2-oxoglutarate aldolase
MTVEEQPVAPDPGERVGVDTPDVSDACDQLGIGAVRTGSLRPVWAECAPLEGRVRTVRLERGTDAPLPDLLEVLAGAAGDLLLVDLGGRTDAQCWGTVLATAARHFGVRGALVNGAVRDVEGLRELGFPTYARGVYPARTRGRLGLVAVDEPVELDGGIVEAGSFAIADASGAVFLPAHRATDVLSLAAELRAEEEEQLRAVRGGADPRVVFAGRPAEAPPNG